MIEVCRSEFAPYEETIYRTIKKKDITAVTIKKNGSIRGTGAKSSRGLILRAYERYKIAKRETLTNLPDDFIDSLIFEPNNEYKYNPIKRSSRIGISQTKTIN